MRSACVVGQKATNKQAITIDFRMETLIIISQKTVPASLSRKHRSYGYNTSTEGTSQVDSVINNDLMSNGIELNVAFKFEVRMI